MSALATCLSLLLLGLALASLRWLGRDDPHSPAQSSWDAIPISIIVPAYNERATICKTIQALLSIQYDAYEIIVVNDGSTDETLDVLRRTLHLRESIRHHSTDLPHQPINQIFDSTIDERICVVDKKNGGKYDALNTGIALSKYPWFCCVDADTILMPDALWRMSVQIRENPCVVAAAGQVRVGNRNRMGRLLVMAQVVEYIRSFVVERIGWCRLNGLVIVPGAFSLFRKQAVCDVDGYSAGMPTEDVELIIKLHRHHLYHKLAYRVLYVPNAVAWTETPVAFPSLARQRQRWYRGLWAAIYHHRCMLFHPRYGLIGLFVLPYLVLFELLRPVLGIAALGLTLVSLNSDARGGMALLLLLSSNFLGQSLISTAAILIDRSHFHRWHLMPYVLTHYLASTVIERSILTVLIAVFKLGAFVSFVLPCSKEDGRWQTSTRTGFDPISSECTASSRKRLRMDVAQ
jgi:cellulose synthase/poly-beta-1,6-N-acetylglucosamine synthase-like glycosyltransferase